MVTSQTVLSNFYRLLVLPRYALTFLDWFLIGNDVVVLRTKRIYQQCIREARQQCVKINKLFHPFFAHFIHYVAIRWVKDRSLCLQRGLCFSEELSRKATPIFEFCRDPQSFPCRFLATARSVLSDPRSSCVCKYQET
jgi:hypothetical protein